MTTRNSYDLYLVCKSNIILRQGEDPTKPVNKDKDFYVGDIFQAKKINEFDNKYIQLRAASKANKKQWINLNGDNLNSDDLNNESLMIMNIFPPKIDDYYH